MPQFSKGGGIGAYSRSLLAVLAEEHKDLPLEVHSLHGESEADKQSGLTIRGHRSRPLMMARRILLDGLRPDHVSFFTHVHLARPLLLVPGIMRGPFVLSAHGSESWKRVRPNSRRLFRQAALTMTNSEFTRRNMLACKVTGNIAAVPLGLPIGKKTDSATGPASAPELCCADGIRREMGERCLLLVGRMLSSEREKGHDELLDVMPELLKVEPRTQLAFIGAGDLREPFVQQARDAGFADRLMMPGYLNEDVLFEVFRHSYGFVMPSRQEGFGLVYLEAMSHALPCVACAEDGGGRSGCARSLGLVGQKSG